MPYYFYRPIWMALIKLAARKDTNPVELVRQIVRERLIQEGLLEDPKQCLHKVIYPGKRYFICESCGFAWETESEYLDAQKKALEAFRKCCRHEWEYELRKAEDHLFRDEKGRIITRIKLPEERVPTRCRKCGLTYEEYELTASREAKLA